MNIFLGLGTTEQDHDMFTTDPTFAHTEICVAHAGGAWVLEKFVA